MLTQQNKNIPGKNLPATLYHPPRASSLHTVYNILENFKLFTPRLHTHCYTYLFDRFNDLPEDNDA